MKILLINNYHYLRGGSERAYFDTAKILEENGHEVAFFSTKNKNNFPTKWEKFFVSSNDFEEKMSWTKKLKFLAAGFYNFEAKRSLEELLKEFKPDIAHLHNIYHHLSPSVIDVLKSNEIPTVMTLHDYQLISPNYNLFANGKIWEASKPDKYWRCVADRCIKNSFWKSLLATVEAYFYKWFGFYENINLFISPSRFLIEKFKEFGFKKKIIYLPNPLSVEKKNVAVESDQSYILYYGRLSAEKGIEDLLSAYSKLDAKIKLKIAGVGPLQKTLEERIKKERISGVEFLGHLDGKELQRAIVGAEFIVVLSRWYENAPYSVLESLALGKIVLASDLGGLPELIKDGENGFLFSAGNIEDLSVKMKYIISHPELKEKIAPAAVVSVSANNPKEYYENLMKIYKKLSK